MLRYVLNRLVSLALSLAVASAVIFAMIEVIPGDPAAFMLGLNASADTVAALRAELGLEGSLPGRYLVLVPDGSMTGISRKLPDTERSRLRAILKRIVPEDVGVIVRTAAEGASEEELERDVARLMNTWQEIQRKSRSASPPQLLNAEPDLAIRVVRDIFNEDFTSLQVAGAKGWKQIKAYVDAVAPDLADRVSKWNGTQDAFAHYRVDEQLAKGVSIDGSPVKRAISSTPVVKPIKVTAPNSVFALGNAFTK